MVVVLPTPFTPTTSITYGCVPSGNVHSPLSPVLFSVSNAVISLLRILLSSLVETYLSRATRSSMRRIILIVVSTPTSDVTRISSRSSKTHHLLLTFLPLHVSVLRKHFLLFSQVLCQVFLSSSYRIKPNNPI